MENQHQESESQDKPPQGVRVLSNGAWQDKRSGQIIKAPPGQAFDSNTGREMALRRREKLENATRVGIKKAVQRKRPEKVIKSFPQAHAEVVDILMEDVVLNEKERGKARVDAYKTLVAIEGTLEGRIKQLDLPAGVGGGAIIHLNQEATKYVIDRLIDIMERERSGDQVVEGEIMGE